MLAFFYMLCTPSPLFYFPPFKAQTLSEPPVAHHFGCCVHPVPAPAKHCPLPLPRLAVLPGLWDPPQFLRPHCCRAGSKYKSTLLHIPREGGLLSARAFLTSPAARSQQIRVLMGDDYSSVNQTENQLWHLFSVCFALIVLSKRQTHGLPRL